MWLNIILLFLVASASALASMAFFKRVYENWMGTGDETGFKLSWICYFLAADLGMLFMLQTPGMATLTRYLLAALLYPAGAIALLAAGFCIYHGGTWSARMILTLVRSAPRLSLSISFAGICALADRICPPREPGAPATEVVPEERE